ncbi:hypothetical protein pb186bvf_019829 [Paramecium bursaria]
MNIISYESESEIPEELRCIFCNRIDNNQNQFIDSSLMHCPTCYDQRLMGEDYKLRLLTNFMQIKCKYCGKYKFKIDLEWHQQKCVQFQQSNVMSYYEQFNKNDQQLLICRNQFCNQEISFSDAYNHQLKCEWRILDCPHKHQCQWRGTKRSFKLHSQNCMKQDIKIEKQIFLLKKQHSHCGFDIMMSVKLQAQCHREIANLKLKLDYQKQEDQDLKN